MRKILITSAAALMMLAAGACGSKSDKDAETSAETDMTVFNESQPFESGQYDATSYDIAGADNSRSGKFDGRLLAALSPEQSVLYIYENGNRTKIKYQVILEKPFEKNDSGLYVSSSKGEPVTVKADSASYTLTFDKNATHVSIDFDKTPNYKGSYLEIMEKITEQVSKAD